MTVYLHGFTLYTSYYTPILIRVHISNYNLTIIICYCIIAYNNFHISLEILGHIYILYNDIFQVEFGCEFL